MRLSRTRITIIAACVAITWAFVTAASAYWIWTPDTKKFINPKYAVKDSPKEQYDWAMSFYDAKDYARAATEFEKLAKHYEYSEYAGKAQYHVGLCYESMAKYYLAFQAYQKAIDNFPHLDNVDEIVAREFNIAGLYAEKENPKVLGTDIMMPTERVVEIYRKVVENAPFGKLADEALFRMGQVLKDAERYDEAVPAFQKILDEYPSSQYTEKARYEVAYCAYKASLKPAYDQEATDKAIKAFSEFTAENKDNELSKQADKTIQRLKDKAAEKSVLTAQFYEKIQKKESAIVYYQDVLDRYPDSSFAALAKDKIEELRSGKKKGAVSGDVPVLGALFNIWPGKAPAAAAAAAPAAKKGWFGFGKKAPAAPAQAAVAPGAPEAAAVAAPVAPVKRGWFTFGGRKEEPVAQPATEPLPLAPVDAAVTAAPPAQAQSASAMQALTEPALAPVATPPSAVQRPMVVASKPVAAPRPPKKKGWSPLGLLGLGPDDTPEPAKAVAVAALPAPSTTPVALEPSHGGASAVPSIDDVNLDKEPDAI